MLDRIGPPITDHDLGFALHDRLHQFRNIPPRILVVPIRVHNNISTSLQTGIEPCPEGIPKPPVPRKLDNVIGPRLPCDLDSSVRRPIVDHEDLHLVDPLKFARNIRYRIRKCAFFVQTRDLDNQLQFILQTRLSKLPLRGQPSAPRSRRPSPRRKPHRSFAS